MTLDEQVRSDLSSLVHDVRPAPDPYGRLIARHRRSRRRQVAAASTTLAVVAVTLVGLVAWPGPSTTPAPISDLRGWVQSIVDAPARGAVAAQPGFAASLLSSLVAQNRAGESNPLMAGFRAVDPANRTVRILFADDIGDLRVAVAALLPPADGVHDLAYDTMAAWMIAPRGAPVATLVAAARRDGKPRDSNLIVHALEPFMVEEVGLADTPLPGPIAVIALAPPGCQVDNASPASMDWRPEPTGSYVVRTPSQRRAEWWRVTCGGALRRSFPAPPIADPANPDNVQVTMADVESALPSARGNPDRDTAQRAMAGLSVTTGYARTARPVLVWGGRVSGIGPSDGSAVVAAAPLVDGTWAGEVATTFDLQLNDVRAGLAMFNTAFDPRDPANLLVIQFGGEEDTTVLAIAPTGATEIRYVLQGHTIASAPVNNGAAVLPAPTPTPTPTPAPEGAIYQAVNAKGDIIARARIVGPGLSIPAMENWGN